MEQAKSVEKYCIECGSELKKYEKNTFNIYTGERNTGMRCENLKCEDGCGNMTRHRNTPIFGSKCRDCGYLQWNS